MIYLLLIVFLAGGTWSCGDFFEEVSQNQAYVSSVDDLNELLMGEAYVNAEGFLFSDVRSTKVMAQTRSYFPWIHLLDDDITEFQSGYFAYSMSSYTFFRSASAYQWARNPFLDSDNSEFPADEWNNTYTRIAVLNSIIYEIGELPNKGADKVLRRQVEGEAYFLRAYYYYWLVNLYAQPYAPSSAANEPGVPLKISPNVEDKHFSRASVKAVYDQICSDLKKSIACFKGLDVPVRPVKANYASACLLLSRVSLYIEDYAGAIAYADSVINMNRYSVLDLSRLQPGQSFTYEGSPETIFSQGGYIMGQIHSDDSLNASSKYGIVRAYTSSPDLLAAYSRDDLRRDIFFMEPHFTKNVWRCIKFRDLTGRISDYMLMRIPEAYLNKAEAQAISGDEGGAKMTLNKLREKRFAPGQMRDIEVRMTETGEDLVSFIRAERRRELCYEGHRWFDLRRYAVNDKYPFSKPIRHPFSEWEGNKDGRFVLKGYYELKPYAQDRAAYVFPLPAQEILFNDGVLEQNEIRPERVLISD